MTRLVAVGGPETAAVGGQHLVTDDQTAIFVQTKLKFGVGNDDALGQRVIGALFVQGDGGVPQGGGVLLAVAGEILLQMGDALLVGDVFVMVAKLRLGGGSVDRLRQLVGFLQPLGQRDAADGAVFLVAGPAAAGDIAADDAFDGQHFQLFAHHALALVLGLAEKLRHIGGIHRKHVVGQNILRQIEPELGHLGQHLALVHHGVVQDHIKAADAVGGDHDEAVTIVVNFADLALLDGLDFHTHFRYLSFFIKRRPADALL